MRDNIYVPKTGDPKSFDVPEAQGGPIACLDWDYKEAFNHVTHQYETQKDLDPFCLK